jgi:hypothetical protein
MQRERIRLNERSQHLEPGSGDILEFTAGIRDAVHSYGFFFTGGFACFASTAAFAAVAFARAARRAQPFIGLPTHEALVGFQIWQS